MNYGNGIFDTIKATSSNVELTADMSLFNEATKLSLESNFQSAVNAYKLVIQNYHDSACAVESMKKIFYCYNRMQADTNAYNDLRSYYISLFTGAVSETPFVKIAKEFSRKCLVKKGQLIEAITAYETAVHNSVTHSDSVMAEVNIIEVYMLLNSCNGNSKFTGTMGRLKPANNTEGLRMINELLYGLKGEVHNNSIPKVFSLSQNFPNPFNPVTKINYTLPVGAKVSIKVYDILGRLVKEVVNEFKEAGAYTVTFDGSSLASGVYFYKIEAGKFVQSKKMVLLK